MPSFKITDSPDTIVVFGQFFPGDTVTIEVRNIVDGSLVPLDDNACSDFIASQGVFKWSFTQMFADQHIPLGSYYFAMKNQETPPVLQQDFAFIQTVDGVIPSASSLSIQLHEYDIQAATYTTIPIPEAIVSIYNSDSSILLQTGTSNGDGLAQFSLVSGSYVIKARKLGTAFVEKTVILSGSSSEIVYGSTYNIPIPENLINSCRVYGFAFQPDSSTPLISLKKALARIVNLPYDSDTKLHAGTLISPQYNSTTGLFYWDLVYGAQVEFEIPDLGLFETKIIPSDLTAILTTI